MKRAGVLMLFLVLLFSMSGAASAATYFVNAAAAGDNSGADWANAYATLPPVLERGSTYYIAGGPYQSYAFDDPLPVDQPLFIYIRKATQSDHGTDVGWEDRFGTEAAIFEAPFVFRTGYYEIDGQVGGGPGSWRSGHGIVVRHTGQTNLINIIRIPANVTNLVFRHMEMGYIPCPTCTGQDLLYSINGGSDWVFQYCYMHHPSRAILFTHGPLTTNVLIEKSILESNGVSTLQHSEVWSARDTNNVVIRHSVIEDFRSTGGIIITRGENWDIYGNIFIWTQNWGRTAMNGVIGSLSSSPAYFARNVNIFNNSFINLVDGGAGKIFPIYVLIENVKAYNNIFYNSPTVFFGPHVAHDYNWFMGSNESRVFESAMEVGKEDPFVDSAFFDFHLRIATSPGLIMPEPYNIDMDGSSRGADGAWDRGTFEFNAVVVNTPPVAADDASATPPDTPVIIAVLINDTDAEGAPLGVVNVSAAANGSIVLNPDQTVTYTPNPGFTGTDSFTYNAYDANSISNTATVTVAVTADGWPVANGDTFTGDEDTLLTAAAPGVLSNDTLAGTNPRAEIVLSPAGGNLVLNADGSVSYEPAPNYNGQDSFSYRIVNDEGLASASASVSLVINPVNDPPVGNDDASSTFNGVTVIIGVLANDIDIDGDVLSITDVVGPQNGAVAINADNTVTYTPAPGFFGADSFTYRPFDGSAKGGPTTVTLTVSFRPVAVDDSYAVDENTPLQAAPPGVLGNDSVIPGVAALLVSGTINGSLVLNPDGSFLYTPAANFAGTDSFTYKAMSGGVESNAATVTITVRRVNSAPVANADTAAAAFNTAVNIPVLANDTDPDGDQLGLSGITTPPVNGTAIVNPDGTVTYTPGAGFSGADTFFYAATDGKATSGPAQVTVIVAANRRPVAAQDSATVRRGNTVVIDVAANDYDPDGNIVRSSVIITRQPRRGTAVNNGDGTITYTAPANYTGTVYVNYNIKDNFGTVSNNARVRIRVNR